jgi:SAM-dependent methyltransferase
MEYSEIALQQVRERRLLIDEVDLWLYEEVAPYLGQRIVEIGCGLGNFARHLIDREIYVGSDVSQESVACVAEAYSDYPNMHAYVADVTDPGIGDLAHFNFDTAVSLNVFEHIENDVLAMRNVRKLLQPGGTLILVVPAHDWAYGPMDRSIGHYRRYNKQKMASALSQAGLTCMTQKYINALGALGWFASGRILRREVPPSGQLRLFNRLVPLLKHLEQSVNMPFGVSLLTVARNDSSG